MISLLFALVTTIGVAADDTAIPPVDGARFVVVGHLYPIIEAHDGRFETLLDAVASERADYVFVLGDSEAWRGEVVAAFRSRLSGAKVFFAPGNHDFFSLQRPAYLDAVGYFQHAEVTPVANYVMINTSESAESLRGFLEPTLAGLPTDRPTLVFGHHRIWNDRYIDTEPYSTHKCFEFSEIEPVLRGRVRAIFSGNVNRQVKEGLAADSVFTCDQVGDIRGYACGMGYETSTYVVCEIHDGAISISPRVVDGTVPVAGIGRGFTVQPLHRRLGYLLRYKQFWVGFGSGLTLLGASWGLMAWRRRR